MEENMMIEETKDAVVNTLEDIGPKTNSGVGVGIGMLIGAGAALAVMAVMHYVTKKKFDNAKNRRRLKSSNSLDEDDFDIEDAVDVDYDDCEDDEN